MRGGHAGTCTCWTRAMPCHAMPLCAVLTAECPAQPAMRQMIEVFCRVENGFHLFIPERLAPANHSAASGHWRGLWQPPAPAHAGCSLPCPCPALPCPSLAMAVDLTTSVLRQKRTSTEKLKHGRQQNPPPKNRGLEKSIRKSI